MSGLSRKPTTSSLCYISFSLSSLGFIVALAFSIPTPEISFSWQRQLVGSIFMFICLLGIVVGTSPSRCLKIFSFKREVGNRRVYVSKNNSCRITMSFKGHHPSCSNFSSHLLVIKGKAYCAGCTGLVIGAVMSILGTFTYFFVDLSATWVGSYSFWLGFIGVVCGLLQYNFFNINRGVAHLFLNIAFVFSAFLLLVSVDAMTHSFILELYLVTSIIYWIFTRVTLSQEEHRKICVSCGLKGYHP